MEPTNKPRRVGSFTLGACLILAGVALLLYYFWPGFNFVLAAKLSPLVLVALGAEILLSAARPEARKYDFLSIFLCLFLLASTFLVSAIPAVWDYVGPQHQNMERSIRVQLENDYYEQLKNCDVKDLNVNLSLAYGSNPATPRDLSSEDDVWVYVTLTGPYESKESFAQSCREILTGLMAQGVRLESVDFNAPARQTAQTVPPDEASGEEELPPDYDEGYAPNYEEEATIYQLSIYSPYQMDWTAAELAAQVEAL